jgi:hypothetical protein
MRIEEIKSLIGRKPFRPFLINFVDGTQLLVEQQGELLLPRNKPGLLIFFSPEGAMHLFEEEAVSSVVTP